MSVKHAKPRKYAGPCACGKAAYRTKHGEPVCDRCDRLEESGMHDPPYFCGVPESRANEEHIAEMRALNRVARGLEGPPPKLGRPRRHGLVFGKGQSFSVA